MGSGSPSSRVWLEVEPGPWDFGGSLFKSDGKVAPVHAKLDFQAE